MHSIKFYVLLTVNTPELVTLFKIFEELQVYAPASSDVTLYSVNVLSMVVMFNDPDIIIYLLLPSGTSIISLLKYQLMFGTGSPTDRHTNVIFSLGFFVSSLIELVILEMTKYNNHKICAYNIKFIFTHSYLPTYIKLHI